MKTTYLSEPDGAMIEIRLAYPITEQISNAQGTSYHSIPSLPQGSPQQNETGPLWLPSGSQMLLQEDADAAALQRTGSTGQLLSVKRFERSQSRSLPKAQFGSTPWEIVITNPTDTILAAGVIQIKGFSTRPLKQLTCTIRNHQGRTKPHPGYITDALFDSIQWDFTTNWFHWIDAPLAPGTNFVELQFTTESGATITSNLVLACLAHLDTTPPRLTIQWPPPDAYLATDFLTLRGSIDDENSQIHARITADGLSETREGLVERNQRFWVEQLPLRGRTNLVTLVAVDSAGNRTTTNFTVCRCEVTATLDPVPPIELWQLQTTVTGAISPPDSEVMLNGIAAQVQPDGRWIANGIPLDADGVAIFDVVVRPTSPSTSIATKLQTTPPTNNIYASLALDTVIKLPGVVLNATKPTYGSFRLRASGVAGKSFVLLSSPNLVDWSPVLTNLNSAPIFEYADTNTVAHGCRFFKIAPYSESTRQR